VLRPHLAVCDIERCGPMAWEVVVVGAGRARGRPVIIILSLASSRCGELPTQSCNAAPVALRLDLDQVNPDDLDGDLRLRSSRRSCLRWPAMLHDAAESGANGVAAIVAARPPQTRRGVAAIASSGAAVAHPATRPEQHSAPPRLQALGVGMAKEATLRRCFWTLASATPKFRRLAKMNLRLMPRTRSSESGHERWHGPCLGRWTRGCRGKWVAVAKSVWWQSGPLPII
jgi:hypothetical protein